MLLAHIVFHFKKSYMQEFSLEMTIFNLKKYIYCTRLYNIFINMECKCT